MAISLYQWIETGIGVNFAGSLFVISFSAFCLVIIRAFTIKCSRAVLFEEGLVYICGSKTTEVFFGDVKGLQVCKYASSLSMGIRHSVFFVMRDNKRIELDGGDCEALPHFQEFYDAMDDAYTDFLLRNVTYEDLSKLRVSFGRHLELVDGTERECVEP